MKINQTRKLLALAAVGFITATSAHAAGIPITNGDFESPVVTHVGGYGG